MKNLQPILLMAILLLSTSINAQVAINTSGDVPDNSAMLDVKSDDKGLLIPRIDSAIRVNITAPATGLLVYQNDGNAGFYFYNGSKWLCLNASVSGRPDEICDSDTNTRIQVEANPNEDIIRFDMAGTEFFQMDSGRLEVLNTGKSVFIGEGSGSADDLSDNRNTAIGYNSLNSNSTGSQNTAAGHAALYANTTGHSNAAVGYSPLASNTSGWGNSAYGFKSMVNNTTGTLNSAFGYNSLYYNTTGIYNAAFGDYAISGNTTGQRNTAIGFHALETNTTGSYNTAIGNHAHVGDTGLVNATAIGANATVNQSNSMVLGNNVNVGIGTTTPNTTALLDLTSTTQGFLPPRLSRSEIVDIISPPEGLVVYNTTSQELVYFNGSTWTKVNGKPIELEVGDKVLGGTVGYIYQPGDYDYDPNIQKGIVVAPSNKETSRAWGCQGWYVSTSYHIGYGDYNTISIVSSCSETSIAAKYCNDLVIDSYDDWYLPSRFELLEIYNNKEAIGDFGSNIYWSSSQWDNDWGFLRNFSDGTEFGNNKWYGYRVRPIRYFSLQTGDDFRLLRGHVNSDGSSSSEGFASTKDATGEYTITFDTQFPITPTCVATLYEDPDNVIAIYNRTNSSFEVHIRDVAGSNNESPQDDAFEFIVVGPK